MPNNCSTLIQRKHLNQILRSNSEGKLQDDIVETTAELCIAGTRKVPPYPSTSPHYLTATSAKRRSNVFATNLIPPSLDSPYDTHLPTIRYTKANVERQNHPHDELRSRSRSKTPLANESPKSNGYTPSASMSSIFNVFAKRSTENLVSTNGDFEETINPSPVPHSRRSERSDKGNEIYPNSMKQAKIPQKQLTDSGVDIRFSTSSGDTNQQHRALGTSRRARTNATQAHVETSREQEPVMKERTNPGQLYQRRLNNATKAPSKHKIDKYRRRSEEAIQATDAYISMNPTDHHSPLARPRPPPSTPTASHPVLSNNDLQASLDNMRSSLKSYFPLTAEPIPHYPHPRNRVKSPYSYPTPQQITPTIPTSNPSTPLVRFRRSHGPTVPTNSANTMKNRRQPLPTPQPQPHPSIKQSINLSPKDLYLAFITSRHLSTLENTLLECDIDRQKIRRVFTWLQGVEHHRHEQSDHDRLLVEQNRRINEQEDNLSLYSEIQYAVDDLPANTSGKECERIATMEFED